LDNKHEAVKKLNSLMSQQEGSNELIIMNLSLETLLQERSLALEAARSKTAKSALLKKLTDFRSLHQNRTGNLRLDGSEVARLVELLGEKNPALAQRLSGYRNQLRSEITLLPYEVDSLVAIVEQS
jgi:uncharacterized protein YdaU (DUF1376 family)